MVHNWEPDMHTVAVAAAAVLLLQSNITLLKPQWKQRAMTSEGETLQLVLACAHLLRSIPVGLCESHAGRAGPCGDGLAAHSCEHGVLPRPGQPCSHICSRIHKARAPLPARRAIFIDTRRGDKQGVILALHFLHGTVGL